MKVLLTGATGLLGGNVARELIRRGYELKLFVRSDKKITALEGLHYELFTGSLNNVYHLLEAVNGCDIIIHTAAVTDQWPTNFEHYEAINVNATLLLLEVAKKLGIKKMIYVSTANCFGYGSLETPASELSEFRFFNYNSGYIMSKFIAQQHVLKEIEKSQVPVVIVNPAFMLGPYDSKPSSGKIILMGLNKKILFCPPGGKSFVDVRDAAMAVCNAITMGKNGECYLLANQNMSYWDFFETLAVAREQAQTKIRLPKFLILGLGLMGSLYEKISRKPAPLNFTNARLLCLPMYYNGSKARKDLQMPQTPFEQTLADTLLWFEKHGMIPGKTK